MEPTHKCLYNQGRSSVGKKIIFSFTSSYDLERVSQSGIGDCVQFPSSALAPGLAPCMLPQSLWVHVWLSSVPSGRDCFLCSSILPRSHKLSPSFSHQSPEPWREGLKKVCHFRQSSTVSHSFHIAQLGLVLLSITLEDRVQHMNSEEQGLPQTMRKLPRHVPVWIQGDSIFMEHTVLSTSQNLLTYRRVYCAAY